MLSFTKLYTINFMKSLAGPFFVVLFPFVLSLLYGSVFRFNFLVPAMLLTPAICASTVVTGSLVADFNANGFYTRLALTKITKKQIIGSIFLFNILMILVCSLINFGGIFLLDFFKIGKFDQESAGVIIKANAYKVAWDKIGLQGYLMMVGAIVSLSLMIVPFGVWIGLRSKDAMNGMFKGVFLFFPVCFMSGIFIDFKNLNAVDFVKFLTSCMPTRWIIEPAIMYWREQKFDNITHQWMIWAGPIAAIVIGIFFIIKAIKAFKYE